MRYTLHNGDCLDVMPTLEANSVDTIITDPPYGLSFMGKDWDHGVPGEAFWREALRVAKPGATLLAFGGTRTFHRLTCAIEDAGWQIQDCIMWVYGSGFPKSHNISKAIDKAAGAEREVVGIAEKSGSKRNAMAGDFAGGEYFTPAPATPAAKTWDGYGTALKPAWEPIIVATTPRDGTYANNALTHGVAGLWIDGARVGMRNKNESGWSVTGSKASENRAMSGRNYERPPKDEAGRGRWPANLIHDGSDEVMAGFGNHGSAARFFYCAKASRAERNAGLDGMPWSPPTFGDNGGTYQGLSNSKNNVKNHHPTVKPVALMRYLARLTKTPTGGVVLDPFAGSGSTGVGAILEGRDFIGIEKTAEYLPIIIGRLEHALRPERDELPALPLLEAVGG